MASKAKEKPAVVSQEDTNNDENSYLSIDTLQNSGINASDISKLKEEGFATIGQLFQSSMKQLLQVKGISEAKAEKILQAARKLSPDKTQFITASSLHNKTKNKLFITTGSKNLDQILGGGLESMSVTEVHGEFRCGKTQLCHTLCVTAQLPRSLGGGAGKVAYVDTEGTFRPRRVVEIAKKGYNLEPNEVLDNIIVARAYSHDAQMDLVMKLGMLFADEEKGHFSLLVVDSVTALFRTDFSGRGELSERQQKLNQHLMRILKHAEEFNIAVLLVNQVMADPGANSMFGPVMKPVGGHVVAHAVHTRILLKKGRDDSRICKIVDSPCMPEAEAVIKLGDAGVTDPED